MCRRLGCCQAISPQRKSTSDKNKILRPLRPPSNQESKRPSTRRPNFWGCRRVQVLLCVRVGRHVHVCIYIYIYTYTHTYKYIVCMYVCMYVCTYVRTYVRTYVCTYVCMCIYACVYIYIYIYMCICIYIYIYIYICVCVYMCVYIYAYIMVLSILFCCCSLSLSLLERGGFWDLVLNTSTKMIVPSSVWAYGSKNPQRHHKPITPSRKSRESWTNQKSKH